MADPNVAEVTPNAPPLEITVTRKPVVPVFRPEGESAVGAGETENMGDQFLQLTQLQQGRAARQALDQLSIESVPKAATAAVGSAVAAASDTPTPEGGPTATSGRSFADSVGSVVKDVGRGTMQAPRAVVQGAGEAVKQVGIAVDNLGTWLDEKAGKLDIPMPTAAGRVLMGPTSAVMSDEQVNQFMSNPGKFVADLVPELGKKPDTVTGSIIHDASQFLTGMAIGGKLMEGAGIVLTGFGKVAATGAFSDFAARDPDAARLSDLIEKYPALKNPVTAFLQAKPDDNEAVKRLKAATEGIGMGVLSEGFIRGVGVLKARMQAGKTVSDQGSLLKTMEEDAAAKYGRMSEEAMAIIGDPKAPLVKKLTPGQKSSVAAKKIEAGKDMTGDVPTQELANGLVKTETAGGQEVYINFGRIDSTEAVKKTLGLMADAGKAKIDAKRGGEKVTFKEMEALAADVGMDVTDLLARRSGQPMNYADALNARKLLNASAERLTELARNIAGGTARPAEEFAFRRQMAVHAAIQAEVIAARTETARALASWNIPVGGGIEASKAIHETLEAMGGSATTQELARRLSILQGARPNNLGAMSDFVRKSVTARTIDAAMEAWKSAMLSGPTTHLSNIFSNTLTAGVMVGERKVGEMISAFRGTPEGVAAGEANALAHGMAEASKDAFRMAWMALKTGEGQFGRASGKADLTPQRAISREALGLPDNVWGNSVDYIGKGFNVPFRFLTAEDEFFKTMAYRAELHAQAQRVAQNEGLTGQAASARMRDIIDNPPEVVRLQATDHALASTYNRELTGALAAVARGRGKDDAVGRAMQFVLPFFRTPVNVFSASVERSPLAFLTQQFWADVKAGGARQDLALARIATGTTVMLVAADLADQGLVTGMISKDPGKKEASERQGIPPYSVKIGNKWFSYNRADPVAMPIAVAANLAELSRRFEIEPDKLDSVREVLAATIGGTAQAALNRSFMQGTAGLITAIADPEQHADQYMKQTLAGFFTPAISNTAAQLADPVKRETFGVLDAIEARVVELSKTLIPRMDLWGREIRIAESGAGRVYDVISPIKAETERPNPIDKELQRLNFFPKRIDKQGSWDGAPVEFSKFPEVYAEYVRLAGNGLKNPQYDNKGAMDFLNSLVEGTSGYDAYWRILSDGPEGGKAQFVQKVIGDYRQSARRQIEQDPRFTDFRQYLAEQGTEKAVRKAPTEAEREVAPMIPRGPVIQ